MKDLRRNVSGFIKIIPPDIPDNGLSLVVGGPECFPLTAQVVFNHSVGGFENPARRAIVLLQANHACVGVLLFKAQNVLYRRTPEFVNALVVIAHNAEITRFGRKQRHQAVLKLVRILKFVDQNVLELVLIICAHVLAVAEQTVGVQDDVVEVHGVHLFEPRLIGPVDRSRAAGKKITVPRH